MARPAWFIQLLKVVFPARSLIARLTQIPAIDKFIEHWLFESDDSIYLPMNEVIQINHAIQPSDEVVLPSRVVEHFIDSANVLWIVNYYRLKVGSLSLALWATCLKAGDSDPHPRRSAD